MSIAAIVVGITVLPSRQVRLTLGPIDNEPPGQETLICINPPDPPDQLRALIDTKIWGGAGELYIGEKMFAERVGYTHIRLVSQDCPIRFKTKRKKRR